MGVRTKEWGPFCWLVLEALAKLFDLLMQLAETERERCELRTMMREVFFLVGFIVPCIYCRISYQGFTDPDGPDPNCDIFKYMALPNGGKKLVYNLHCRVSKKLSDQERAKCQGDKKQIRKVNSKWKAHCPSYKQALTKKFPEVSSWRFWNALFAFSAYMMCDYEATRAKYLHRFFWLVGQMLMLSPEKQVKQLASIYLASLAKTGPLWERAEQGLSTRLDIVWVLVKNVLKKRPQWKFRHTRASFEKKCQKAIVGCVPLHHQSV